MELLSQVVIAILGGSLALTGVFLANKLAEHSTEKRNQQQMLRGNGEELYSLISKWSTLVFTKHLALYSVMRGELTYNEHLDIHNNSEGMEGVDPHRMELLIYAYFPKLISQYKLTRLALEKHNIIVNDHKNAYKQNDDGYSFIEPFQRAQIKFEQESDALKEGIIEQLSAINN